MLVALIAVAYVTYSGREVEAPAEVAAQAIAPAEAAEEADAPANEQGPPAEVAKQADVAETLVKEQGAPAEAVEEAVKPVEVAKQGDAPIEAVKEVEAPAVVAKQADAPAEAAKEAETPAKDQGLPAEVAKQAEAPIEAVKEAEAPAEVAKQADAPTEVASEQEGPVEVAKEAPAMAPAEVPAGLLKVTIGPRGAPKTHWAVNLNQSTMAQLGTGDPQEATKVGTGLDLVGVALTDESEAPLANVYVHGNYAYVGGMSSGYTTKTNVGIRILDISDPTKPELVGRIPLRSREPFDSRDPHSHGDAIATHIETDAFQGDIAIVGNGVPDTYTVDDYPTPFGI